jgi:CheY-specific phosphatase CheX/anti-anti-sigma regulatory factor
MAVRQQESGLIMITKNVEKNYLLIKATTKTVDVKDVREYLTEIKNHSEQVAYLIFDFSEVTAIPHAALRTLTFAVNFVNQPNTKVALIGNSTIKLAVRESGLEKLISCHENLELIFKESESKLAVNQDHLIETIGDAVKMALKTIASTDVEGLPIKSEQHVALSQLEIGAVVGLTGNSFRGTLTLGMTNAVYLKIMSKMLDTQYTEVVTEIEDGPAELLNMMLGHLKVPLNEKGMGLVAAIPTTIRGSNLKIVPTSMKDSTILLNFNSEFGDFYIELSTHFHTVHEAA